MFISPRASNILFEFVDWVEELAGDIKPGAAQKIFLEYGYLLWEIKSNKKLYRIIDPGKKGPKMFWATKKNKNCVFAL